MSEWLCRNPMISWALGFLAWLDCFNCVYREHDDWMVPAVASVGLLLHVGRTA